MASMHRFGTANDGVAFDAWRPYQPQGAAWPVPVEALSALADLGMSDEAIARYFRVAPADVRQAYGRTA